MGTLKSVFAFLLLCTFLLISCAMSMQQGQAWLDRNMDAPGLDVTGTWMCPEFGMALLNQEGRNVTGAFYGGGLIKGSVSGDSLSLLIYDTDAVHYIARLQAADKTSAKGEYVRAMPGVTSWSDWGETARPMNLIKMPPQK